MKEIICVICNKRVMVSETQYKRGAKYCSQECYHISKHKENHGKIELTCQVCGKSFYRFSSNTENAKYCSTECYQSTRRGSNSAFWQGGTRDIERKCLKCGKIFTICKAEIDRGGGKYCSKTCLLDDYHNVYTGRKTSIELKMEKKFIEHGISFTSQFRIKNYIVDFLILDKIIVQCDGDYWHNLPKQIEKDRKQDNIFKEMGYTVIRLWEHEINGDIEKCMNKVLDVVCNDTEKQLQRVKAMN